MRIEKTVLYSERGCDMYGDMMCFVVPVTSRTVRHTNDIMMTRPLD